MVSTLSSSRDSSQLQPEAEIDQQRRDGNLRHQLARRLQRAGCRRPARSRTSPSTTNRITGSDLDARPDSSDGEQRREADRDAAQQRHRRCGASDRRADAPPRRGESTASRHSGTSATASAKAISMGWTITVRAEKSRSRLHGGGGKERRQHAIAQIAEQRLGLDQIGVADARDSAAAGICDGR